MTRSNRRRASKPSPRHRREPLNLAGLLRDPEYLAIKEGMGEPLSAEERETLRAWRTVVSALDGKGPAKIGGGQ
jgi:hypothetical protein